MRFTLIVAIAAALTSVTARPHLYSRTATVCVNLDSDCQKGALATESCCVAKLYAAGTPSDASCHTAWKANDDLCHLAGRNANNCTTDKCCVDTFLATTKTTTASAIAEHKSCTAATSSQFSAYKKLFSQ